MQLRPATADDLAYILALEARPDIAPFILPCTIEEHLATLEDPDAETYLLHETASGPGDGPGSGTPAGFVILRGLASPHGAIELKRIVVERPNEGRGRRALQALIRLVFEEEGAHRFWLDVFPENARAHRLYLSLGFKEEGRMRHVVRSDQGWRDLILMAMLADEAGVGGG